MAGSLIQREDEDIYSAIKRAANSLLDVRLGRCSLAAFEILKKFCHIRGLARASRQSPALVIYERAGLLTTCLYPQPLRCRLGAWRTVSLSPGSWGGCGGSGACGVATQIQISATGESCTGRRAVSLS